MCAGTVVEPPAATSAAMVSVTSRSRSVALKPSFDLSALIRTLARMGMVLRRSTTRCTWPSDFSSAARSTVTFILQPACSRLSFEGATKVARMGDLRKAASARRRNFPNEFALEFIPALSPDRTKWRRIPAIGVPFRLAGPFSFRHAPGKARSLLQLPLQEFDLLGERRIRRHQVFDLAYGVQHGGVVTATEAPSD